MRIKKHSNKNDYLLTESGVWVRDFTKQSVPPTDVNNLTLPNDYKLILQNELQNRLMRMQHIDTERFVHKNIVIVSDGCDYKEKQKLLLGLPKDVAIIAVNGALAEWQLLTTATKQKINYYVVNNPYAECMGFFPRQNRYFPKCIASMKTNSEFIRQYAKKGTMYRYISSKESNFCGMKSDASYHIDDYRNPVCAAIGLAYRMDVEKLMLFCCDSSYNEEKAGMVKVKDKWAYPQQVVSHDIIDGNLHWLRRQEDRQVDVVDHSSGPEYKNATYIRAEEVTDFFRGSA